MKGYEQAAQEYEYKLFNPYDYEDDEEENDEQYWSNVDRQMEDYKLGDY